MKELKAILLVLVALMCLALVVAPASAAPPISRVSYHGSGITGPENLHANSVPNAAIKFSGTGFAYPDQLCTGQGSFEDTTNRIKVRLNNRQYTGWMAPQLAMLVGDAEVTVDGVRMPTQPFMLILDQHGDNRQWLSLEVGTYRWDMEGVNAFHGGRIRMSGEYIV